MSIFKYIPANNRTFAVAVELDNSNANTATTLMPTLILGQKTSAGTAAAGTAVLVSSQNIANELLGRGSQAAIIYSAYRKTDPFGEVWVMPLADAAAGTKASSTVTVTGSATGSGTLSLYVNGTLVQVGVTAGDLASEVATNIAAAVNAKLDLPCTATANSAVATLTARNAGVAAGDLHVAVNLLGRAANEQLPAGITVTFDHTPGTGDPEIADALAAVGDKDFPFVVLPYTGANQLNDIQEWFSEASGRYSWLYQLYGVAFSAIKGTLAEVQTFGLGRNDKAVSVIDASDAPEAAYVWAAVSAGAFAVSVRADPALPLHNIALPLMAPATRRTQGERNTLLYSAVTPVRINDADQVITDHVITTYRENEAGAPDNSYLDVETIFTLREIITRVVTMTKSRHARKKLLDDDTPAIGPSVITARLYRGDVIGVLRACASEGLIQNIDTVIKNLSVTKVGSKLHCILPVDVAQQLREVDILVSFSKS